MKGKSMVLWMLAAVFVPTAALLPAHQARAQTAAVPVMNCAPATAESFLDANNVRAKIMNNGALFWNGGDPVYEVPKGGGTHAMFAAGIWLGGLVDGELRAAATTYGPWEFWPGPHGAVAAGRDCAEFDRIYKVERRDLVALASGSEPSIDVQEWPWQHGAPVVDGDGNPDNYDLASGDRPLLLGDEMHWWIMNDIGNEHTNTDTPPMGVEVQGMAFSSASTENPHFQSTTHYLYRITNRSGSTIDSVYFGVFQDVDLGNFSDDYIGSDTLLALGYGYNADNDDEGDRGYGLAPPAIGVQFTRGPRSNGPGPGLAAFAFFSNSSVQGIPNTGPDYYNYLKGRWLDGQMFTVGGNGRSFSIVPTPYMFSGDPVTWSFWSELNADGNGTRITPADRRSSTSTGPFTLAPGEEAEIFLSLITAFGSDHLNSVTVLKEAAAGFLGMQPEEVPSSPTSGVVPTAAPRVLNVATGATGQPLDLVLRWAETGLAGEEYEIVLEPGGVLRNRNWQQRERHLAPGLEPNTDYLFRVRAATDHGYGPWSEPVAFSTGADFFAATLPFAAFLVVANGAGPLVPPTGAAADFQGFPVPERPSHRQQVGEGRWMIHLSEADARDFDDFLQQVLFEHPERLRHIVPYALEIRFTEEGSRAWSLSGAGGTVVDVPFELWRSDVETLDDPSDDVRLIPWVSDIEGDAWGLRCVDHIVSTALNDPQTDPIHWQLPSDMSPGDAGYRAWVREVEATGHGAGPAWRAEILEHLVLVNWNGGDFRNAVGGTCEVNQDMPETGTVFRIVTERPPAPLLGAPLEGSLVRLGTVDFYWSAFLDGTTKLEVARDRDFSDPVLVLENVGSGTGSKSALKRGDYYWRVTDVAGSVSDVARFTVLPPDDTSVVTGIGSESADGNLPQEFALLAPWPNPSKGGVNVPFELPEAARVTLRVFDVLGREVATLLDRDLPAGRHETVWDAGSGGAPRSSGHVPGGAYIIRLEAGSFTKSRVVTIL